MKRSIGLLSIVMLITTALQLNAQRGRTGEQAGCINTACIPATSMVVPKHFGASWEKTIGQQKFNCYCTQMMVDSQASNSKIPMGPGPVVLPPSKSIIDAARQAAAGSNMILPKDFGKTYVKVDQKNYDACYFFPTSYKNGKRGFAACANSAYFGWEAAAQCQAVTPLNLQMHTTGPNKGKPIYMHLGSYANPHYKPHGLMGGQSQRCNLYGRIEYRPVSLWDRFVREF